MYKSPLSQSCGYFKTQKFQLVYSNYFHDNAFEVRGAGWSASVAYGALSLLVFFIFMFSGKQRGEWKALLPGKADIVLVKNMIRKFSKK